MKSVWKIINQKDSSNLVAVAAILDQYGWLGQDLVGEKGNATLFLVIQHADRAAQEKYLPMMREAVKQGKAAGSDLALLEDRVAFRQGKKQIYGSQVGALPKSRELFILPLEDPDHVDERRANVGLEPLADYLRSFGLKWDAEKYKKDLPKLEQKLKENAEKTKKK